MLLDTSVLVGAIGELATVPDEAAVSVLTLGELLVGVHLAPDAESRERRLEALTEVERRFEPLPIDVGVARRFALLVVEARQRGRRPRVVDTLIAATALAHGLVVHTRDRDFERLRGVQVIFV